MAPQHPLLKGATNDENYVYKTEKETDVQGETR